MNTYTKYIWAFSIVALLPIASYGEAVAKKLTSVQQGRECVKLISECFASAGDDRSNCFLSSAKAKSCDETPLGKLTLRRWAMSPSQEFAGREAPPAFLGPQLVDKVCISNFDNEWSSALIQGQVSLDAIKQLETKLSGCVQEAPGNLLRP